MEQNNSTQEAERDAELANAKRDIEEVLKKYRVVLIPVVVHQGDKTFSRIDIVSAD